VYPLTSLVIVLVVVPVAVLVVRLQLAVVAVLEPCLVEGLERKVRFEQCRRTAAIK